ncbi:class F sortase [Streptomyces justiciae]|uniref:class F sortase n=1 Tax=Streptomyces justiciae TaxID=2780140 RepID=UPI00187ECF70|nr:class F sortase [Streptomyces justiciae]
MARSSPRCAPRRGRRHEPRRPTRAYRLARTAAVAGCLILAGVLWTHDEDPGGAAAPVETVAAAGRGEAMGSAAEGGPGSAGAPGVRAGAGAVQEELPARGTGLHLPPTASAAPGADTARRGPTASEAKSGGRPPATTDARRAPAQPARPGGQGVRPPRHRTTPALRPLPRSRATRLLIPYLDVDAPVTDLRLDRHRRLEAPPGDDPNLVGWYKDGPAPGGQGTAVAVGHLDTDTGGAVFAGLSELKRGRLVEVRRADGRTAVYTVDAVREYEKAHFPDREVYGARGRPELRLITCGGTYDRRKGYSGNLVVFAHLVAVREAPARH